MTKHMCINGTLDDAMYSSPVPFIGLYVAAASLVCSLAMLYDILSGFRSSKRWLPCRWFSLNSVTLTLISIVAKIPVDLTTKMSSAQDQISKLSGTTMILVSMCFFIPSLGTNHSSECLTNMASLSIFVVTVIVNVCIQIRTGVVFEFVAEHIIVMCCLLIQLMVMWFYTFFINGEKDVNLDTNKDIFAKSEGSMYQRLKLSYLYGYYSNPQFIICRHEFCTVISGGLCTLCLVAFIQALFRSRRLKFCEGVSDYKWSMSMIVVIQILAVVLGSFSALCRWYTMSTHEKHVGINEDVMKDVRMRRPNPLLEFSGRDGLIMLFGCFSMSVVTGFLFVFLPLVFLMNFIKVNIVQCYFKKNNLGDVEEYKDLLHIGSLKLDKWLLAKSLKDLNKWMEVCRCKSLSHLSKLLSRKLPSQPLHNMELKDEVDPNQVVQVSFLSIALLVRIAQVSMPHISGALVKTYNETCEAIRFINERIYTVSHKSRLKSKLGEAVRNRPNYIPRLAKFLQIFTSSGTLQPIPNYTPHLAIFLHRFTSSGTLQPRSDFDRALVIMKELKNNLPSDIVRDEVGTITDFITRREYSSIEDLYDYVEQMFVNMIHMFLAQLPHALYKEVTESSAEEFDERVKLALKLICMVEVLEDQIQWSFPVGCNISSMITAQDLDMQNRTDTLEEDNVDANVISPVTDDAGNNA